MPTVTVIAGTRRIAVPPMLVGDPPLVPAQNVLVELEDDSLPSEVLLNEELRPIVRTTDAKRGHLLLDCFRSTGFHRVVLSGQLFCFGTADAKLELDGVLRILDVIGQEGLSWGHQIMFSSGATIRDPRVDYSWLRGASKDALSACISIAERPLTRYATTTQFQRPRGGRLRLSETISRLRSDPGSLLEEHERGMISVGSRRYMPRMASLDARGISHDTIANRRATRLIRSILDLIDSFEPVDGVPKRHRQWLAALRKQFANLLDRFPFNQLARVADCVPEYPAAAELSDERYRRVYELSHQLHVLRGWEPSRAVADRFAYVGYSDEIYQAFVAVLLAGAFGAERSVPFLRPDLATPCFSSEAWDIYYDTAPPSPAFGSWRDLSSRPARLTPDYCILNKQGRRAVLGDAKYRANADSGRLPTSSLGDCQVYMQHFGLKNFAVFYPGADRFVAEVSGGGYTILEVSITPFAGVRDWVAAEVRPRLERLLEPVKS